METLDKCPVCGQSHFREFIVAEDYTVSHQQFQIQQCDSCQFLFTNPRPAESEIGPFYESQEYISHHDDAKDLMSRVYNSVRDYTIQQKIKLINKHTAQKGTLLDIGCGTGSFASAIQANGWNVNGTEPDSGARAVAQKRIGDRVFNSISAAELTSQQFDAITMWHVLEHVHQINETIDWLNAHLKPNGTLVIAVPNPESHDAAAYGKFWAAYDVPRHLYHFTKNSMKLLLGSHGFEVQKTLPMWFDSFYVSMLSTKYRHKKIDIVNSATTGLMSNWKGRVSGGRAINTSSIIYIVKKK
ncbi:class I SAM-dependent methyltransferase [Dyadobacter sp. CY343]|uniref:class I SAM-dependent methyltransferase n=1 Tax=Dyadobacter sp. CY343 TaxID=2907299 RepID=UPI001F270DE6|nr:class I SAM-dependent methyltransferase [Dyadobacter sp. CY343]MCE7063621.1 class I SAM-dependent methyltransferase [Dyadobacter sp. CY343]